jgi:PAS domain S-box-containing protein
MVSIVRIAKGKCKRCYQCIRSCPVKAIKIEEDQAVVIEDRCIVCGFCITVCNQKAAKVVENKRQLLSLLKRGDYVVAVLDPSFVASFYPHHPLEVVRALKEVGFSEVWDGGVGADIIVPEYKRLLKEKKIPIIFSHCCGVVNLIEKYYPKLLRDLVPVASPMIAVARFIRSYLSPKEAKIVYIGPCIAKKSEGSDKETNRAVDEVLTFKEAKHILLKRGVSFKKRAEFDGFISGRGRLLAIVGGISKIIGLSFDPSESRGLVSSGVARCKEILSALEKEEVMFKFIELTLCDGGCITGGPAIQTELNPFTRRQLLIQYVKEKTNLPLRGTRKILPPLGRNFTPCPVLLPKPTSSQIKEILARTGKYKKEDELNCGACGYRTCKERAIAVFQGLTEADICMHYLILKSRKTKDMELKALIEQVGDGVVAIDTEMRIILFNKEAERITEYPKTKAIGRLCKDVFHGSRCETPDCPYKLALAAGRNISGLESSILTMNGKRIPIRSSIALMRDERGRIIGGIKTFSDISKLKEIEEMKNEFISHVSHELRTPIASIRGAVDLLFSDGDGKLTSQQKELLTIIKNNAGRLSELVTDLLDFSKMEAGKLKLKLRPLSIQEIVEDVLSDIGLLLKNKGLEIEVKIPEDLSLVPMDGDRIKQVLTNLISNAVKYTPKGKVSIFAEERDEELIVSVRDTGIGIASSLLNQIFEKFCSIDPNQPRGRSVGLGLPICKGIIEAHQGRIWVESELGKGSAFYFTLPKKTDKDR